MIHCSAGIGRSGTFCIVDTALLLLERGQRFDIKELVLEMRRYRMGLIQTAEQLRFSYLAIIEGAEQVQVIRFQVASTLCVIPPLSSFPGFHLSSSTRCYIVTLSLELFYWFLPIHSGYLFNGF